MNDAIRISDRLDPIYETIGLLYGSYHMESFKEDMISQLDALGLNGEVYYAKHLTVLEQYYLNFTKQRADFDDAPFFFGDEDGVFYLIMMFLIIGHPSWLREVESLTEDAIRDSLQQTIIQLQQDESANIPQGPLASPDEIVAFLSACTLGEAVKWKLLRVLLQPKRWLVSYAAIVNANVPAYEHAYQASSKPIHKLIESCVRSLHEQPHPPFVQMAEHHGGEVTIVPSFVTPLGVLVNRSQVFYGVLVDSIASGSRTMEDVRDYLLMRLKALSDSSKLQLLSLLKERPKYNLELANQLGITAATASHHMNVLLASELVGIEKMNGKVYYHLNQEQLKQFIQQLEHYFLS